MEFKEQYKCIFSQVRPRPDFSPEDLIMKREKHYTVRKMAAFVLAAALILGLSVTAYATELFGLMDLAGRIVFFEQRFGEGQERYYISGFSNSPESKAYEEWTEYHWNLPIVSNEESAAFGGKLSWYGCFNQEAADGLYEIAEKYHLKIHEEIIHTDGGYRFPDGAFKEEIFYVPDNQAPILLSVSNIVKGYLPSYCISIGDPNIYLTEEYVTKSGQRVVFAYIPSAETSSYLQRFLMLANLKNSVVVVHGSVWEENAEDNVPAWEKQYITVDNLKMLADTIDFGMMESGFANASEFDAFCDAIGSHTCPAPPRKIVSWSAEEGYSVKVVD